MDDTGQATPLQEELEESPRLTTVVCSRGHENTPYPTNGRCVVCQTYLPGNPSALTSEKAKEINEKAKEGTKAQREVARRLIEDKGTKWAAATEEIRQLALQYAKTGNNRTLELFLQQMGLLKARPKPGEEQTELKYEVSLTSSNVEDLRRSLSDLEAVLRID